MLLLLSLERTSDDRFPFLLEQSQLRFMTFQFCKYETLASTSIRRGVAEKQGRNSPSLKSRHFLSFFAMKLSKSEFCSVNVGCAFMKPNALPDPRLIDSSSSSLRFSLSSSPSVAPSSSSSRASANPSRDDRGLPPSSEILEGMAELGFGEDCSGAVEVNASEFPVPSVGLRE